MRDQRTFSRNMDQSRGQWQRSIVQCPGWGKFEGIETVNYTVLSHSQPLPVTWRKTATVDEKLEYIFDIRLSTPKKKEEISEIPGCIFSNFCVISSRNQHRTKAFFVFSHGCNFFGRRDAIWLQNNPFSYLRKRVGESLFWEPESLLSHRVYQIIT